VECRPDHQLYCTVSCVIFSSAPPERHPVLAEVDAPPSAIWLLTKQTAGDA
jgi:hypothetical protein